MIANGNKTQSNNIFLICVSFLIKVMQIFTRHAISDASFIMKNFVMQTITTGLTYFETFVHSFLCALFRCRPAHYNTVLFIVTVEQGYMVNVLIYWAFLKIKTNLNLFFSFKILVWNLFISYTLLSNIILDILFSQNTFTGGCSKNVIALFGLFCVKAMCMIWF